MDELGALTCALYGKPRTTNLNLLHYKKLPNLCYTAYSIFKASESIDFPNLPPCLRGVKQHIKHVNYEVAIQKQPHISEPYIPSSFNEHGWTNKDGPFLFEVDVLTRKLAEHVEEVGSNDTSDEEGGTNGDFLWQIVIYINHVVEADESQFCVSK